MNNQNESNKITIRFIYQFNEYIEIESNIDEKLEIAINELCSRLNIDKTSIFCLYNGNALNLDDFDKSLSSIINSNDRQIKKINILVYKIEDPQLDDINIMLIVESLNVFILKGKKDETLKSIIQKVNAQFILDIDKFEFINKNKKINLDKKFEDIADEYDTKINRLIIYANHKEKIIVKFVNDKYGEKRVICFPQDIIDNVIKNHCFPQVNAKPNFYFFKYKNKEIDFYKTINELYNDGDNDNEKKNDKNNSITITIVNEPDIIDPKEIKEIK